MTQLQVFARPCGIVLCSHWVLHSLDVLLEVVQRAENVLHALAVIHEETGGVRLHVAGAFGLLGGLDGQWLDDLTGRTLRNAIKMFEGFHRADDVKFLTKSRINTHWRTGRTNRTGVSLWPCGTLVETGMITLASFGYGTRLQN